MRVTHSPNRGVALIEVIVAVSIVMTIGMVTLPSFASWNDRYIVVRDTKRIQRAIERAYIGALIDNCVHHIKFESGALIISNDNNAPTLKIPIHKNIQVKNKRTDINDLTFYPSHTTTPTTINISNKTAQCSIVISLRGRVRRAC